MEKFVETGCVFKHEGREFEAGGSYVAEGQILGYVKEVADPERREPRRVLTTWKGEPMNVELVRTSVWTRRTAWQELKMESFEATVDGSRWHGRKSASFDALVLRPSRKSAS